jgi:hypothetical protein
MHRYSADCFFVPLGHRRETPAIGWFGAVHRFQWFGIQSTAGDRPQLADGASRRGRCGGGHFRRNLSRTGDIQGRSIFKAIKNSFLELGWDDAAGDRSQLPDPPFSRFIEILRGDPKPDRGLRTLLSRLEELEDYGFFQSHGTPRNVRLSRSFALPDSTAPHDSQVWESEHPVVLRIHSTQNDKLAESVCVRIEES